MARKASSTEFWRGSDDSCDRHRNKTSGKGRVGTLSRKSSVYLSSVQLLCASFSFLAFLNAPSPEFSYSS